MQTIIRSIALAVLTVFSLSGYCQQAKPDLKVVFIRHGEKPALGDNLTCKGLNRSMLLPAVLYKKIGVPNYVMVPSMTADQATKHARMFETVLPFAVKYNLIINSAHTNKEYDKVAADIKAKKGTVLVVWEHKAIAGIVNALGVQKNLSWDDDDFDSMWTVTFSGDEVTFSKDKEDLHPKDDCSF